MQNGIMKRPEQKVDFTDFNLIAQIGDLLENGLPRNELLNSSGVYSITCNDDYSPAYFSIAQALDRGNVIHPWPIEKLQAKWVEGKGVLYYGLAGRSAPRSLRSRLGDLLRHGRGNTTSSGPHKGGEILWQLKGYEKFSVWIKPTGLPPEPRDEEMRLLHSFYDEHGSLPFANRQF